MDSTATTSASPPASATPAPLHLAALRQPALVRAGAGWLSLAPRLWLQWALAAAREALEFTLDRPVDLSLVAGEASEAVFAIGFDHPAAPGGLLAFDLPAARAVVDALASDFANLRGPGPLSEAELGVLEYAALACVDRALRAAPPAAHSLVLCGFHDARATRALLDELGTPGIAIQLRIAGREGTIRLHLRAWPAEALAAPPGEVADKSNPRDCIEARLALPPLRLDCKEAQSLQAGDVLLLGATDFVALGASCRLVTSLGWVLCPATIVRDSPTVVTVRAAPFALDALAAAAPGDGQVILNLMLGSQSVAVEQLQRWQPDTLMDLMKDPSLPIDIQCGLDRIARGELVRLDGELAVRLVDLSPLPRYSGGEAYSSRPLGG